MLLTTIIISKKENETHYNPTLLNPSEGVTNLISGKYIIKAVLKNPPHTEYEQVGNILPFDRKIEFDLKTFGGVCDNRPSIKVNVKKRGISVMVFGLRQNRYDTNPSRPALSCF
ncbi:hypothetical protein QIU18_01715 [Capnocytophaga canimorsus]|nr:hypothetical protein [Capnocytophaga canimorsus]WGU68068.1 hypothetical protein QIU19_12105 [Capnocytophaga canimorsus]WGU70829.1 hypothetical protein QIU18_01715 [Capnocytophaga canimorsus]